MITVSSTIRNLLENKYRQVVRITVSNTSPSLTITAEDIAQGGLSIDRYCVSGSTLEMGSAIASELTLTLLNYDGRFDDVSFEGKELHVEQGVTDDEDETHWFDMGYFIVDTPPRKKSTISITALDRMTKFDEEAYAWSSTQTYPMTVASFVSAVCSRCLVTLGTNLNTFPNNNVSIPKDPITDASSTFRNIIQWAAAIMGTCAYINESGELVFTWTQDTDVELTSENRYQGADLHENDVTITGYIFTETVETETEDEITTEDVTYVAGTIVYPIDLTSNPLITGNIQSILNAIYTARGTVTYRPFECTTFPYPFIMPLDKITYTDPNGNEVSTIVTNAVHNLNLGSAIASKGETSTSKSYSSGSGFTPSQSKELTKTQILIEAASSAAASAQASASEAQVSAGIAYGAAEEAKESARSANNSANNALVQLSIVEDVAGTLDWISRNGTYVLTGDTTVRSNKVYFKLEGGDYVPIANPPAGSNPSALGWYVLDISNSQAEYIMAHLAVTSAGLWVLPVDGFAPHFLYDSNGNLLVDSDNNPIVDAVLEPDKASGYKVLLSSTGMSIYNEEGAVIAKYSDEIILGNKDAQEAYARFDYHSMQLFSMGEEDPYFWVSDLRDRSGEATVSEYFVIESASMGYETVNVTHAVSSVVSVVVNGQDVTGDSTIYYWSQGMLPQTEFTFIKNALPESVNYIYITYKTETPIRAYTFGNRDSEAPGSYSVVEGYSNAAVGYSSHAEGMGTKAMGQGSHSEGIATRALGHASHAQNWATIATGWFQTAMGMFNEEDPGGTYSLIIGGGVDDSHRTNILTVDWNGNLVCGSMDSGRYQSVSVPGNSYVDFDIDFNKTFTSAPIVTATFWSTSTAPEMGYLTLAVHSITTTGFTARVFNKDSSTRAPYINWIAMLT